MNKTKLIQHYKPKHKHMYDFRKIAMQKYHKVNCKHWYFLENFLPSLQTYTYFIVESKNKLDFTSSPTININQREICKIEWLYI